LEDGAFTDLERDVITLLLSGDDPDLPALRMQFEHALATNREMTGVGFWTKIATSDADPVPGRQNFELLKATATIPAIDHGAGFVLFVREGRLSQIEGFTFDEPWPDDVAGYSLARID
jgi:hypothetical protein